MNLTGERGVLFALVNRIFGRVQEACRVVIVVQLLDDPRTAIDGFFKDRGCCKKKILD